MQICSKSQKKKIQYTSAANFPSMVLREILMFLNQLCREMNTASLILKDTCINKYFAVWMQQCSIYFGRIALLSRKDLGLQYWGSLIGLVIEGLEANL